MMPPVTTFWGKLTRNADDSLRSWHPLLHHCADVAAVMEALLSLPIYRRRLSSLAGRELSRIDVDRLCYLTALHDAGKVNHGFQAKVDSRAKSRWAGHVTELLWVCLKCRHPVYSEIIQGLELKNILTWFPDEEALMRCFAASVAHHGKPIDIERIEPIANGHELWEPRANTEPVHGLRQLSAAAREWFPGAFQEKSPPLPNEQAFFHAFSGLVMLADWIGSNAHSAAFPYSNDGDDEHIRMTFARGRACAVLQELGLDVAKARDSLGEIAPGFERVRSDPSHEIRAAQAAAAALPMASNGSVVVLEAETGSGKTEAALLHFFRSFHAGLVDGMYFALPTRTAAIQIHQRIVEAVKRVFVGSPHIPAVVLGVPGYLRVDDAVGVRESPREVVWQGEISRLGTPEALWNDDERERFRFRGWAAEHPKRYLAGAVVVGTIDQVLLSALRVNHAHMRMGALWRHLLVVDEVHASDAYMSSVLEEVLERHQLGGGHALLMSATLGASARSRFLGKHHDTNITLDVALAKPYPLLSTLSVGVGVSEQAIAHDGATRAIGVQLSPIMSRPEDVARRALDAARDGARVLIIRNTVNACVATQQAVEHLTRDDTSELFSVDGVPAPHHARFAREDRVALDLALESALGKQRLPGGRGVVVVATQTVQQSLDIDADWMLSDLCPMDVLLQRVGRLHRHARAGRPAEFERPRVEVLVPEQESLSAYLTDAGIVRAPRGSGIGTVYEDLRILETTWQVLAQTSTLEIPRACRELVESSIHPEVLKRIAEQGGPKWITHAGKVEGQLGADRTVGRLNTFRLSDPYGSFTFERSSDGRIQTRLGEGDRLVDLPEPVTSPFGREVRYLTVPSWLLKDVAADAVPENFHAEQGLIEFELGSQRFVYDRWGLRVASAD